MTPAQHSGPRPDFDGDGERASGLDPARGLALRRREFLGSAGGAAAVAGASALAPGAVDAEALAPVTGRERQLESFVLRLEAARHELSRPPADHPTNGDEERS